MTVRIGITAHLDLVPNEEGDGILHYVASAPYVKAVRRAGALPVLDDPREAGLRGGVPLGGVIAEPKLGVPTARFRRPRTPACLG